MANYLVTDTDLQSIANAIRTKGGTSGSLTFPDGFVDAIGDISTGGGELAIGKMSIGQISYAGSTTGSVSAKCVAMLQCNAVITNPPANKTNMVWHFNNGNVWFGPDEKWWVYGVFLRAGDNVFVEPTDTTMPVWLLLYNNTDSTISFNNGDVIGIFPSGSSWQQSYTYSA